MRLKIFGIIFCMMMLSRVVLADAPATQPASVRVLVFPVQVIGDPVNMWVGKAIQEGIVSGLERDKAFSAGGTIELVGSDTAAAIKLGVGGGADVIVMGTCQIVEDQMRVTGQIISVHSGKNIGALHSQGALRDLFNMEDALASQAVRMIKPAPAVAVARAEPVFHLPGDVQVYQPRYFDGNIRRELAVGDRFQTERDHYNFSQYQFDSCGFGYFGCWGLCGRNFFPGSNGVFGGFSDW